MRLTKISVNVSFITQPFPSKIFYKLKTAVELKNLHSWEPLHSCNDSHQASTSFYTILSVPPILQLAGCYRTGVEKRPDHSHQMSPLFQSTSWNRADNWLRRSGGEYPVVATGIPDGHAPLLFPSRSFLLRQFMVRCKLCVSILTTALAWSYQMVSFLGAHLLPLSFSCKKMGWEADAHFSRGDGMGMEKNIDESLD